ncbi:hypothetical protein [Streptomyces silvensis]|uniref:Bulb-type lectin domain-containing protein n=1 Tax=Streptomyces silvensis TaxID=1765722 RepID=A0A0W7X758_9ACTN|nr:hypothetical protein [Streptomyces silvensis]KUF18782.1 hypothetical protein AT728_06995 [Streptomyces silvensis]
MKKKTGMLCTAVVLASVALVGQASAVPADHSPAAARTAAGAADSGQPGVLTDQVRYAPFTLNHHESLSSDTATLVQQSDGNLVIYDEFNRARWAANTVGRGWTTRFQTDGNLVVYTRSGRPVWASNTDGYPGARLVVQDDGNVVIYHGNRAIWASGTDH